MDPKANDDLIARATQAMPIRTPFETATPMAGVDLRGDYQLLRVTNDGYAILHPDLIAMLGRIELMLEKLVSALSSEP